MARAKAAATARRLAQIQRANQCVKALGKELVYFGHNVAQLCAVKVALHQLYHVIDQQVALHLHDRLRVGADEQHHKIVA